MCHRINNSCKGKFTLKGTKNNQVKKYIKEICCNWKSCILTLCVSFKNSSDENHCKQYPS